MIGRWLYAVAVMIILGVIVLLTPTVFTSKSRYYQEIDIPVENYTLKGYLSIGSSVENPWVVFTHGNRKTGQEHELYKLIRNNLSDGVSVLAIDFRGFGKSRFGNLSHGQHVLNRSADIDAAIAYLHQNYGAEDDEIILLGHSLGAVQVLNASKNHTYRMVISIGPGDFNVFINDLNQMNDYIEKFRRNTGVMMTEDVMKEEASQLTPETIFSPCSTSPIVLVFGSRDNPETLLYHKDRIPEECASSISWLTIPFSNHTYGTESALPEPLRFFYSRTLVSFLLLNLNNLLAR